MINGILVGLGRGTGLFLSLFLYTRLEKRYLFLFYAIFNITGAIIYSIYCLLTKSQSSSATLSYNTNTDMSESMLNKSGKIICPNNQYKNFFNLIEIKSKHNQRLQTL